MITEETTVGPDPMMETETLQGADMENGTQICEDKREDEGTLGKRQE